MLREQRRQVEVHVGEHQQRVVEARRARLAVDEVDHLLADLEAHEAALRLGAGALQGEARIGATQLDLEWASRRQRHRCGTHLLVLGAQRVDVLPDAEA